MSLQWTVISWFVYAEAALVLIMCLPGVSVQRWRRILRSRLLRKFDSSAYVYFNVFFGLLILLLIDAYRKMRQHALEELSIDERVNPHGFALSRMRKFRSQVNFTLSAGALLLWIVLKWMVSSLIGRAFLEQDLSIERAKVNDLQRKLDEAQRKLSSTLAAGVVNGSVSDDGTMAESSQLQMGYKIGGIDKLEPRYKCAHCHLLLREPMQGDCGHRYCRNCVQLKFNEAKQKGEPSLCLECDSSDSDRAEISPDRTYPDMAIKREINKSLKVQCPNSPCDKVMQVRELDDHLQECKFRPEPCELCGELVAMQSLAEHKEQKCRRRLVPCDVCKERVAFESLDEHKSSTCIGSTVECEFCLARVKDNEEAKSSHWLEECPVGWHTGQCPFGCPEMSEGWEKHRIQHQATHIDRLLALSKRQQQQQADPPEQSLVPVSGVQRRRQRRELQCRPPKLSRLKEKAAALESRMKSMALPTDLAKMLKDLQGSIVQGDKVKELLQVIKEQFDNCYDKIRQYELRMQKDLEKKLDIERKHQELVKLLAYKEMKILDLERRVEVLEHAGYDGVLVWKITDVRRRKEEAREGKLQDVWTTLPERRRRGKNTHISLFFVIMRGAFDALLPWPFAKKVSMMLLDQNFDEHVIDAFKPDTSSSSFKRPSTDMNIASGCPLFMPLADFENGSRGYVKDDAMFIKFIVDKSDLPT
uniref:RING-type domain-containing protein n=1 Tax=Macrostomum lignano TaxID=282301 RepID=A0A1I8H8A3_9PLAT